MRVTPIIRMENNTPVYVNENASITYDEDEEISGHAFFIVDLLSLNANLLELEFSTETEYSTVDCFTHALNVLENYHRVNERSLRKPLAATGFDLAKHEDELSTGMIDFRIDLHDRSSIYLDPDSAVSYTLAHISALLLVQIHDAFIEIVEGNENKIMDKRTFMLDKIIKGKAYVSLHYPGDPGR